MKVSKKEIIDFYASLWSIDSDISDLRENIKENIEIFSEETDINKKVIRKGYGVYKTYKKGNSTLEDDAYIEIVAAIEEKFLED